MKKLLLLVTFMFVSSGLAKADSGFDTWDASFSNKEYTESSFEKRVKKAVRETVTTVFDGESGYASYYWQPQAVACGGRFNPSALTAAHRTLPCGTKVKVTNTRNGKTTVVTINDRGPYVSGRIIDLSKAAAIQINMTGAGVAPVRIERF